MVGCDGEGRRKKRRDGGNIRGMRNK